MLLGFWLDTLNEVCECSVFQIRAIDIKFISRKTDSSPSLHQKHTFLSSLTQVIAFQLGLANVKNRQGFPPSKLDECYFSSATDWGFFISLGIRTQRKAAVDWLEILTGTEKQCFVERSRGFWVICYHGITSAVLTITVSEKQDLLRGRLASWVNRADHWALCVYPDAVL